MVAKLDPSRSDREIAKEAKKLLADAVAEAHRAKAARKAGRSRAPIEGPEDYERWRVRDRIHEFLVEHGFVRGRRGLIRLFDEIFPLPEDEPDLEAWFAAEKSEFRSLRATFAALRARDASVRRRAAKFFADAVSTEWGMIPALALGTPRTIERLLAATTDAVPEVQSLALRALEECVDRSSFYTGEVFETVLAVHARSENAAVRFAAVRLLAPFDDPRRWTPLAEALGAPRLNELARKVLPWCVGRGPRNAPPEVARVIVERLLELVAAEKKPQIRSVIVRGLGTIGDRAAAERLRALKPKGFSRECLDESLAAMQARAVPGRSG